MLVSNSYKTKEACYQNQMNESSSRISLSAFQCTIVQGTTKRLRPGLVNFVPAVAYGFFLNLPAAFTQPGWSLLVVPCKYVYSITQGKYSEFVETIERVSESYVDWISQISTWFFYKFRNEFKPPRFKARARTAALLKFNPVLPRSAWWFSGCNNVLQRLSQYRTTYVAFSLLQLSPSPT